jgi:hypothetical protein
MDSQKNVNKLLTRCPFKKKGDAATSPKCLFYLVGGRGFEPPTPAV